MIQAKNLSKTYAYRPVLDNIDLHIAPGETVCLLGPNGAGKTSLLKTLLHPPPNGNIQFQQREIRTAEDRREYHARIAYLGHEPGLYLELSPLENLHFLYGLHHSKYEPNVRANMSALLQRCGLGGVQDNPVRTFSRGMRQRLALARVFLNEPALILLDEPLTGLDRQGIALFLELIQEHADRERSALIVTHTDQTFLDAARRFLFLKDGHILADISREDYTPAAQQKVQRMLY